MSGPHLLCPDGQRSQWTEGKHDVCERCGQGPDAHRISMTLPSALQLSLPTTERAHHLPIRRAAWAPGIRIVWRRDTWQVQHADAPMDVIPVLDGAPQGCLTPASMIEEDWEVVE